MDSIVDIFFSNLNLNWEMIGAIIMIIICPITWNLVARFEFYTKRISNLVGDNRLAADIFAHILIEMGIFRNFLFTRVIKNHYNYEMTEYSLPILIIGYIFFINGFILNLFSYYRLGIHGIYYGDYFGVLCKEMVTAFPYNVLENPLYVGSTSLFLGSSIIYRSPSGILLTLLAWGMYKFASILENPMTPLIYSVENIQKVKLYNEEKEKRLNEKNEIK